MSSYCFVTFLDELNFSLISQFLTSKNWISHFLERYAKLKVPRIEFRKNCISPSLPIPLHPQDISSSFFLLLIKMEEFLSGGLLHPLIASLPTPSALLYSHLLPFPSPSSSLQLIHHYFLRFRPYLFCSCSPLAASVHLGWPPQPRRVWYVPLVEATTSVEDECRFVELQRRKKWRHYLPCFAFSFPASMSVCFICRR